MFHRGLKNLFTSALILAGVSLIFLLGGSSATLAQNNASFVRQVRTLETDEAGLQNPAGLAYSSGGQAFHAVEARGQGQPLPTDTDIIKLTAFADHKGVARVTAAIQDPINMAFDDQFKRLLIYQSPANKLIEVLEDADGNLNPATLVRHDAGHFNLDNPQGMTIDPASGHLYILDATRPRLVRIEPDSDGDFDGVVISEIDLQPTGIVGPRGLPNQT